LAEYADRTRPDKGARTHPYGARIIGVAERNPFPIALTCLLVSLLALASYGLLVADSWMSLVAGREIIQHGLPHRETLTVIPAGREWIDQQWLAQVALYGTHRAFGIGGVAILDVLLIGTAVGSAMAAARSLGATARSTFLVTLVCLFIAPWSWQIRAQAFALPLFVWCLWLAADHVRRPSRRAFVALPLLVLWANVHGSVVLGAGLVVLAAICVAVVTRANVWVEAALAVGALAAVFVTPYGTKIVDYYHLLLVDPPFGHVIVEWQRTTPGGITAVFFVVLVLAVPLVALAWRRRTMTTFEILALGLVTVGALQAVRGLAWFALAATVLLPNALDALVRKPDKIAAPRVNVAVAAASIVAALVVLTIAASRPQSWFERQWPRGALEAVRSAGPDARVYGSDRHSDWLLWKIPSLQGRLAYDVRFELVSPEQFSRLANYVAQNGSDWKRSADGYRVIVIDVDSTKKHLAAFRSEPGARVAFRKGNIAVVIRGQS